MSDRRILPAEARALRDSGAGNLANADLEHIVALDSLIVITNPNNPVSQLTLDQLRGIYAGEITNWAVVGGPDAPIVVADRSADSGTRSVFVDRIYGDAAPAVLASANIIESNNETAAFVNSDVNAIGYVGYAFQRGAQAVTLENECGLTMKPDAFSARTEEYSLQRYLYLYHREDMTDMWADDLLEYSISAAADEVIAKAGFIDLGVDRRAQTADSERGRQLLDPNVDAYEGGIMREMLTTMLDYDRLSTTFRFRTGSQSLDQRGQLNLERLADYLETRPAGTNVVLVGFTDDVGAFDSNRDLSVRRAQQVLVNLTDFAGDRLGNIELSATGFGEVAPAACNTTGNGQRINRRVEVWIQNNNG